MRRDRRPSRPPSHAKADSWGHFPYTFLSLLLCVSPCNRGYSRIIAEARKRQGHPSEIPCVTDCMASARMWPSCVDLEPLCVILHLQVCNGINRAIQRSGDYVWYWSRSSSGRLFALWLARLDILDGTSGLHRSAPRPRGLGISISIYVRVQPDTRRREVEIVVGQSVR